jgi:hypothetical protein
MRKITFILLLFILFFVNSKAQQIAIEFTIEWKNALNFNFKEFESKNIHPAYLNIIYRNISEKPLYCLKITDGKFDLPQIIYLFNRKFPINLKEQFPYPDNVFQYYKKGYIVGFKSNPIYLLAMTWNIRIDTTFIANKTIIKPNLPYPIYDIGFVNEDSIIDNALVGKIAGDTTVSKFEDGIFTDIDLIYNYICRHYYPEMKDKTGKDGNEQLYHYSTDITKDTIMNNSTNKFVFLKPEETYVDKYNLIGFQITGGTFTFQLDDTKSLDYVETEPVYKDESKFGITHYLTKQLPLKVGEYELFTGEFLTNKVTVHFPGIKVKE